MDATSFALRRRHRLLAVAVNLAACAGCLPAPTSDAGDAQPPSDIASSDTAPADAAEAAADAPGDDVADAPTDAPNDAMDAASTCSPDPIDPANYYIVRNTVTISTVNARRAGGMAEVRNAGANTRMVAADPIMRSTDCQMYSNRTGSIERGTSGFINYGAITFRQGGSSGTLVFDTMTMQYTSMTSSFLAGLVPGMPVEVSLPDPDGGTYNATAVFEGGMPDNFFTATFTDLAMPTVSHATDTVITWTPPTPDDPTRVATLQSWQLPMNDASIICAVPACRGRMVLPASLTSSWTPGGMVTLQMGLARSVPVPPASRTPALNFWTPRLIVYSATVN